MRKLCGRRVNSAEEEKEPNCDGRGRGGDVFRCQSHIIIASFCFTIFMIPVCFSIVFSLPPLPFSINNTEVSIPRSCSVPYSLSSPSFTACVLGYFES